MWFDIFGSFYYGTYYYVLSFCKLFRAFDVTASSSVCALDAIVATENDDCDNVFLLLPATRLTISRIVQKYCKCFLGVI